MSTRRIIVRRRPNWTLQEWERGWELAMTRIEGAPALVVEQPIFRDCLIVMNGAFADGNHMRFELGLNALVDFCTEVLSNGVCKQWWE
jgi:hypothetical protein